MRVRVNSGRTVTHNGTVYQAGGILDVADDDAERLIANGDAKATLRSKPIVAPRPLSPNQRARGKR